MNPIVTLVDFSDVTPTLMEQTQRFAQALGMPVILVHIVSKDPMALVPEPASQIPSEEEREELIAEDLQKLLGLAQLLRAAGVDVQVKQLVDADIRKALLECQRWSAGLIIVGSHHHGALYNRFVGSVTNDVIRSAKCVVLVVPANTGAAGEAAPTPSQP